VRVRTTPFTCGCQASVAIKIRMKGTPGAMLILEAPTFGHGYFRRVTSSMRNRSFLPDFARFGVFSPAAGHPDETILHQNETIFND
jgi:hypothetical protein